MAAAAAGSYGSATALALPRADQNGGSTAEDIRQTARRAFERGLCCAVEVPFAGGWSPSTLVFRSATVDDVVRVVEETRRLGADDVRLTPLQPLAAHTSRSRLTPPSG